MVKLTQRGRADTIEKILRTRFSTRAFDEIRRGTAGPWDAALRDMSRGIHGETLRERQRLAKVSDMQLIAESAALSPARA